MTLLEAAQKALPGLAWEQIGSSEVEYIYAEKNGDGYGVFDLADLDELVTDMTVRRDALDDLLGATPRCVMTDELAALRAQLDAAREEVTCLQAAFDELHGAAKEVTEVARLRDEFNPPDDGRLWVSRWQNALRDLKGAADV